MDPFTMMAIAGVASAAIGGGASLLGGQMANESRENSAYAANAWGQAMQQESFAQQNRMADFNAMQAKLTRDWQENMSNTSYRRAMTDMRLAGLNPILAYAQGGATTPSGATGTGQGGGTASPGAKADIQDAVSPAVSNAMQGLRTIQGIQTAQAELKNIEASNALIQQQARQAESQANLNNANTVVSGHQANLVSNQVARAALEPALVQAQTDAAASSAARLQEQTRGDRMRNDDYEVAGPEGTVRNALVSGARAARAGTAGSNVGAAGAVGGTISSAREAAERMNHTVRESVSGIGGLPRASDETMGELNNQWRNVFRRFYESLR